MGAGSSLHDVEALTDDLEQAFARVIPRTPRGSLDVASCDRGKVRQVVDGANKRVEKRYADAWNKCAVVRGETIPAVDELRNACAALVEDFHEKAPRCALAADAGVGALVDMASHHGAALHEALERLVTRAGGEYVHGPQKAAERIAEKAKNDYDGDVARVVDVERATGLFDSLEDLNAAVSVLREASGDGSLTIRRFKDCFFTDQFKSGYRDLKVNVEVSGFVGELQLNLRRIKIVKDHAHKLYNVDRVVDEDGDEALYRAIVGLDLESEQVLSLAADGGQSVLGACGRISLLAEALAEALPPGCEVANVYNAGGAVHAHVRLGIADVAALARLRDAVLFEGSFETAINEALPRDASQLAEKLASESMRELGFDASVSRSGRCLLTNDRFLSPEDSESSPGAPPAEPPLLAKLRVDRAGVNIHVDRGAFMECYARIMMRFTRLTMHQREKLEAVRRASVAVLLAPAGGGKTFVAVQRVVQVLNEDPDATVLFVARNEALALFVCKWLVIASRKSAEHVVERVHVLVAPFSSGPRCVRVEALGGRRRLVLGEKRCDATTYALIVVDEAHHLVGDSSLRSELAELGAAESSLLFLGDVSQATSTISSPEEIARSLVDLPQDQGVVVATLSEVVRSTKRIVAGAAAFQLEAGRKAETSTHSASAGPPLVARIFTTSKGDDAGETYAREVVEALTAIRRQLVDLEDLDDRVAVVGPDEAFIEKLREPLGRALGGFELVDAATASAVLPRGDTEARAADAKQLLVVDSVDNMDGLERLVIICVGLDQVIDRGAGVLETRSRLYRAMTRAQLAVAVVNEVVPGGWLEFLGRVELDDEKFDDAAERENRAETAADDVVGAVAEETSAPVATHGDATTVSEVSSVPARGSDGAQKASPNDAVDAPVAEKAAVDADAATTPSEAEPMKVLQSIWDASAVATASRGDLRFMPFSEGVDLSKLVELRTLKGHSGDVNGVAVFPDGRRIVSASDDETLKVWDVATGECVATLEGHSRPVWGVAMFPDGRRIVSGSSDNTLKVWNIETGECVATLEGHSSSVLSVAVFPDGRRVVSASSDKTLKVWDVATGECVATLEGHSSYVFGVAVFPDGQRVVSGSDDSTLKVWDVATGECVATLEGHSSQGTRRQVLSVAVFPDGRRVVSASGDNTLKVWDVATGECLATLKGHSNIVKSVAISPDGRRVVSGSRDETLKVWDVATGECVATLKGHSQYVTSVAISPDGRRVVSGSGDKTLKLWGLPKS